MATNHYRLTPNEPPSAAKGWTAGSLVRWLLDPDPSEPGHLWPRWLWLRALGLIFGSAFYSLLFQINGLIGPRGILPAGDYLRRVAAQLGWLRFWYAPTLLWLNAGTHALAFLCWAGLVASLLLVVNVWPRGMILVGLTCFLSFVTAAQDFSSYQSDGMLLSAGFLSLFFAPPGFRPGPGITQPPSRASLAMLRWLWFTIYFESGLVKILSHDPHWRHLTALDDYYQNGPLPNWIGWYAQQMPHSVQAAIALATLIIELGVSWMIFLPRPLKILCFCLVTPFQIGIILTANLTFLNYFVLALGFLLLDDRILRPLLHKLSSRLKVPPSKSAKADVQLQDGQGAAGHRQSLSIAGGIRLRRFLAGFLLGWVFYDTAVLLVMIPVPGFPAPTLPIAVLEPFRIANQYGLFAVMTTARYEIEFQGTRDGTHWEAYPFRYKPQDVRQAPRCYAPYQPRFDWNLWFATLGSWREYPWVTRAEVLLLRNDPAVLSLFAGNPFPDRPPLAVRTVRWQYWFTDLATRRRTGLWWRREFRGLYGPVVELDPNGQPVATEWPPE